MLCTDKHILISRFALYHSSDQVSPHPYPWPVLVVLSSTASPRVFSHSPSSYFCIAQSPFKVIIVIYCTIGVASWQKGFSYPYPLPHTKKNDCRELREAFAFCRMCVSAFLMALQSASLWFWTVLWSKPAAGSPWAKSTPQDGTTCCPCMRKLGARPFWQGWAFSMSRHLATLLLPKSQLLTKGYTTPGSTQRGGRGLSLHYYSEGCSGFCLRLYFFCLSCAGSLWGAFRSWPY